MTTATGRNADSSPVNAQSNAERQKRYRDRKRGGPPVGRWPQYPNSFAKSAGEHWQKFKVWPGVCRTNFFMAKWVIEHASREIIDDMNAKKTSIVRAYRRLRDEHERATIDWVLSKTETFELGPNFSAETREAARSLGSYQSFHESEEGQL
jgi:hypothetical protein